MTQALRPRLVHIPPIHAGTRLPHFLPPLDEDEHGGIACPGEDGTHDEHIPTPHAVLPRRDAVIDGEAERVPDQDEGRDELAAKVTVGRGRVLNRRRQAQGGRDSEDRLSRDESEPM
jgi:hypothetical protein